MNGEVYNKHRSKTYDNNSMKTRRKEIGMYPFNILILYTN